MSSLDDMLENQQKQNVSQSVSSEKSCLRKISGIYIWIGGFVLVFGIIGFLSGIINEKPDALGAGVGLFFGGLFTIFAGCIGEAIDDIRNNTKNSMPQGTSF